MRSVNAIGAIGSQGRDDNEASILHRHYSNIWADPGANSYRTVQIQSVEFKAADFCKTVYSRLFS